VKVSGKFVNEVTLEEKELLSNEDIRNGYRLACCTKIYGDTDIYIPWSTLETKQRIQIGGEETKVELSPIIKKFIIKIPKVSPEASLNDERSNFKKIKDKLSKNLNITIEKIDSEVLKRLSEILRKKTREIAIIVKDKEIIHVELTKYLNFSEFFNNAMKFK